ncbi:MAG TPA: EAL domain-containing protein [Mycobacterium sp.]|nr:EAL domain-containing protein [Mycobacterium sp.]
MNDIVESIPHIVWTASPDGFTSYVNRRCVDFTGCSREANYGGKWIELVHPDDVERAKEAWSRATETETGYEMDYRIRRFDGAYRWHSFRALPVRDGDGHLSMWIGTATDIEDQKQLELSLRRSEREAHESLALLRAVEAAAPVGFTLVDRDLRVVRIDETLARINGRSVAEHIGRTVAEIAPDLWSRVEPIYHRALRGEAVCNVDLSMPSATEPLRTRHWLASFYPVWVDGEIIGVGNVVLDITERKEAEEFRGVVMDNLLEGVFALDAEGRVAYVNRAASQMLGWSAQELLGKPMHETVHFQRADGTPVPTHECALLRVRTSDIAIRIVDDAFTRKDGTILPVAYSSAPLRSGSTSNGLVVAFRDLTEEKVAQVGIQRELAALSWIGRIRDAIDDDRLVLYAQPIVPLNGGRPGEELLLRIVGLDGEIIRPASFLPIAEKYGLITEIDRWVISRAAHRAARGTRVVSVNLSATSISNTDLLPFIERQLRETGADPADLLFEITETALMQDMAAAEAFAHGMSEIGCGLALDDFGTGFGGFTYLKRLPLRHLKIDLEFVRDLAANTANRHVVRAIVSLAHAFGLQTIAEGVEGEDSLAVLRAENVDYAQGYHLGPPAPAELTEQRLLDS